MENYAKLLKRYPGRDVKVSFGYNCGKVVLEIIYPINEESKRITQLINPHSIIDNPEIISKSINKMCDIILNPLPGFTP